MKKWISKIGWASIAGLFIFLGLWILFPFPESMLETYPAVQTLTDRSGRPLRVYLGANDTFCDPVALASVNSWAAHALVAAEDKRFFHHPGVDPLALLRSLWINLRARDVRTGASTLSTQVIRLTHPRDRNLWTKCIEAFRALQMERKYSKREVLEQYLNRAPFGSNLVGIQAASRSYFNKDAADLNLAESSLLMGLPQSPSRFRPDRHLDRALLRRAYVLERMRAGGQIDGDQEQRALRQPLDYLGRTALPFRAPHFCDLVYAERIKKGDPFTGPLSTTLDAALQEVVEEVFNRHRERLRADGIFGGAAVVIEVKTGSVRALLGSPDYQDQDHAGQVNAAVAPRSPGSALKPFAYLMAMDQGRYTPETVIADVPMHFRNYEPENFSRSFAGVVTARESLVQSLNMPALRITRELGLEAFVAYLRRLGLSSLNRPADAYGISVVLGTAEVKLLSLANAYASLAREGQWRGLRLLEQDPVAPARPISSRGAAWMIADMLSGDERALEAEGHAAETELPRVAWKTGTSNGLRDAWALAYNPEYVVGIWVGNPNGREAPGLVGIKAAAPIAMDIFRRLYPDGKGPWYVRPASVVDRSVCGESGWLPGPHCKTLVRTAYLAGQTQPRICPVHLNAAADAAEAQWPVEVVQFQRRQGKSARPSWGPSVPLRIVSPLPGATYRVLDGATPQEQSLALKAISGSDRLFWFIEGKLLGQSVDDQPLYWTLTRGHHQITCCDKMGNTDRVSLLVE